MSINGTQHELGGVQRLLKRAIKPEIYVPERYKREVRARVKCGGSTRMKRQQCLERGQERATLIYTLVIGNSRVLHLNRILGPVAGAGAGATWEGDEGQGDGEMEGTEVTGSLSMAALLFLSLQTRTDFGLCAYLSRISVQDVSEGRVVVTVPHEDHPASPESKVRVSGISLMCHGFNPTRSNI